MRRKQIKTKDRIFINYKTIMGGCCESDKGNQEAYLMYSGNLQGIKPANKNQDRFEERKHHQQKINLENSS